MCYKVIKMRIEPNSSQRRMIDYTMDYNRYIFNFLVTANKLHFRTNGKLLSEFEMNNLCTQLRQRWECFRKMHSMTHSDVSRRVHQSCKKCMDNSMKKRNRAIRKGIIEKDAPPIMSWPRYRNQGRYDSYAHLSSRDFKIIEKDIEDPKNPRRMKRLRKLKLGKVKGEIRCYNQSTPIQGEPRTCIIFRKDMGTHYEYYASISYGYEPEHPGDIIEPKSVGIDMGIRHIAATSDGELYDHNTGTGKDLRRLKKLSSDLSENLHDHGKRRKSIGRLKHHHAKMVNKRKDNIEKISKRIVDDNDVIIIERLNVKKLWGISKSKSMTCGFINSSLGLLRTRILNKAECAGKKVIEVDPRGTSQMCSQCGADVKKSLGIRVHECPYCGFTADRDINAAINILHKGWTGHPVPERDESPDMGYHGMARTKTIQNVSMRSF